MSTTKTSEKVQRYEEIEAEIGRTEQLIGLIEQQNLDAIVILQGNNEIVSKIERILNKTVYGSDKQLRLEAKQKIAQLTVNGMYALMAENKARIIGYRKEIVQLIEEKKGLTY